ncbi:uncharacterized protein C8Q71DRAFT_358930 [Rhodofomes roseus]|uniref:F-box domain-containing protein n=1 Tax=Rhodofomes roseus TaxID=34475 RepID=A0ABQ8K1L8_9APHY|nr:uncharacterized protein C8Q71DRAFT_358930 [Rhodofomes roseus]KAH9830574.1 hypothetical protein C8Q71DRAFT_358930 [Rhodofomes roseus]
MLGYPRKYGRNFARLPRPSRRICLSVSRAFHDIALSLVFYEFTICFGAWESYTDAGYIQGDKLEDERSSRSFDLLYHIIVDPHFASVIRDMEVHAYKVDGERRAFEIRECMHLNWNRTMRNLRPVPRLFGDCARLSAQSLLVHLARHGPQPTVAIIDSLARLCRSLRHLSVPMESLGDLPLERLNRVCSIGISTTSMDLDAEITDHSFSTKMCTTIQESLQTLEVPFRRPADIPAACLPNLTHLNLVLMKTFDGLERVLRGLPDLRLLSITTAGPLHQDAVYACVSSLQSDLPNLESFGVSDLDHTVLMDEAQILADFLRNRLSLRRVDYAVNIPTGCIGLFLEAIGTLKNLEVFHMAMLDQPLTQEFSVGLLSRLPSSLVAMSLSTDGHLTDRNALSQFWAYFTNLQYLYIRTWAETDITVDAIVEGSTTLELVGYNGRFYDVERRADQPLSLSPWSHRKLEFRNARDLGCEGWEWLMRYSSIVPEP